MCVLGGGGAGVTHDLCRHCINIMAAAIFNCTTSMIQYSSSPCFNIFLMSLSAYLPTALPQ